MPAMTVCTVGDIPFLPKIVLSMATVIVVFGHPGMAAGAVNPSGGGAGARETGIHIGVAFHAGNILMS